MQCIHFVLIEIVRIGFVDGLLNDFFFVNDIAGKFICGSVGDLVKPKFINEPFDVTAYEGTTIELPCAGKGNPKPEVISIHSIIHINFNRLTANQFWMNLNFISGSMEKRWPNITVECEVSCWSEW